MTNDDLNCLAWPAMKYALHQKTFVVEMVCRTLIRNAKHIRADIKNRMHEQIVMSLNADEENEMDHYLWGKVLKALCEVIE